MAFDFLGTFNKSQFERFLAFAKDQLTDVVGRIRHISYEKRRMGNLVFEYDKGGTPLSYTTTSPATTYIGGLVSAYEVLGGQVKYDLQVRTRKQAVYILDGSEYDTPSLLSNGEILPGKALADSLSAEFMAEAKAWLQPALHYRREYLERKVRRALDYVDQLDQEQKVLETIVKDKTVEGSLEEIAEQVGLLFAKTDYRAIFDDKGSDPYGRTTYAPFLPYSRAGATVEPTEPGPAGRDTDGVRQEGQ